MKIIDKILQSDSFKDQSPVLVDIGASGEINAKWKAIAPWCICLAYDADDREFRITEETNSAYRKLITFNRIVTAEPVGHTDFYLTASPFCSSLLEPDQEKLKPWVFSNLFSVEKKTSLPAITLEESFRQANITYVDWFKTDTQGTDLRLFNSLSPSLQSGILAVELEPGILDAYKGEDKLYSVMQEMHKKDMWLSSMEVKGVQRLNAAYVSGLKPYIARRIIRRTPGWAEVTYLRQNGTSVRQCLLLIVFALLEKQYGFGLEVTEEALRAYPGTGLFRDCREALLKTMAIEKRKAPLVYIKQKINKLLSNIND
jgi:hypothetical protein